MRAEARGEGLGFRGFAGLRVFLAALRPLLSPVAASPGSSNSPTPTPGVGIRESARGPALAVSTPLDRP